MSGLLGLLSFSVFLWALSRSPVATVSALRETSVLFAILIGALLHKERFSGQRMAAGVLIVLGDRRDRRVPLAGDEDLWRI